MNLYSVTFLGSKQVSPPLVFYNHEGILKWMGSEWGQKWLRHHKVLTWYRWRVKFSVCTLTLEPGMSVDGALNELHNTVSPEIRVYS